jgi:predicted MFS family arabinose efflux permease
MVPTVIAFVLFGSFAGTWSIAVADVEHTFGLSDATLGFVIAVGVVAAAAVNTIAGALTERWGSGVTLARALVIWAVLLIAQGVSPALGAFAIFYVLGTAASGLIDVVMNILAADKLGSRPGHLVRFHGLWNFGSIIGALVTGVILHFGASWRVMWIVIAALALLLGGYANRNRRDTPRMEHQPSLLHSLRALRDEGLVVFAIVFAAAAMVETGLSTWGVLYLRDDLGMGVLAGVSAFVVGQILATATRMAGGPFIGSFGARRGVMLGGALAVLGLVLETASTVQAIAAIGLAVASVGITVVWPLLMAEVSVGARHPSIAIGGVTAAGYVGIVAGPAVVGAVAGLLDLRVGLSLLVAAALFVTLVPARVGGRTVPVDAALAD